MTTASPQHDRFHLEHAHLASPFGQGGFGQLAELMARFFGTPIYLAVQTTLVVVWIALNAQGIASFDPYPFILLNLAFSTQAAYAAPLILLAQTRQAAREKAWSDADARHREELSQHTLTLLQQNTELTARVAELSEQIHSLTREIHESVRRDRGAVEPTRP